MTVAYSTFHRFIVRPWHWLIGPPPRDHRGRRVNIITLTRLPGDMATRLSKLPPDIHERVFADIEFAKMPMRLVQIAIIFCIFIGMMLVYQWYLLPHLVQLVAPAFGTHVARFCLGLLIAPMPLLMSIVCFRRTVKSLTITSTLKFNHCPSCGYSLETAKADPADGCTLCPECGAAWRIPTSTQPT